MPKVSKSGTTGSFYCPGCKLNHTFVISADNYNGDGGNPTVSAKLLYATGGTVTCNAVIESGHITFFMNSRHSLAGKTVELPNMVNGVPQ